MGSRGRRTAPRWVEASLGGDRVRRPRHGVKRTQQLHCEMSAYDPKRTSNTKPACGAAYELNRTWWLRLRNVSFGPHCGLTLHITGCRRCAINGHPTPLSNDRKGRQSIPSGCPARVSYGVGRVNSRRRAGRRQERTPRYAPRAERSLLAASWGSLRTALGAARARRRDPGRTVPSLRGAPGRTPAATQVRRIA